MFIPGTSIFYVENFLDVENHTKLLKLLEDDYDDILKFQEGKVQLDSRSFVTDERYTEIIDLAYNKASALFNENYNTASKFAKNYRIQYQRKGHSYPVHKDTYYDPKVTHGAIFYINDDYEGGEIYYPALGIELKPKANSFVIHPSKNGYEHGVKEVLGGDRINITYFAVA